MLICGAMMKWEGGNAKESECRWVHVLVVFACELKGEGMCNEWCFVMHG